MSHALNAHTPLLSVVDCRGLAVRRVACHRRNSANALELRVTRQAHDTAGRLVASQDPRLPVASQRTVYSLSGQALLTGSVDAGWGTSLLGEAGQPLASWDSRSTERQIEYDELLRTVAVAEQNRVVERFTYGGPETAEHNQCNQLIRHDDTAGTLYRPDYGLSGSPLTEVRHFLRELEMPDWPLAVAERDALLETDDLESTWAFNALGEVTEQTDAMGNTRQFKHTIAGQLKSVSLGGQVLLSEIRYNAFDQIEQETAGNGVISRSTYDPQNGRLTELSAALPDAPPLQHLKYGYDPVGNIEQIEDAAQPVRFFASQRIEPINQYRYDTLYQLIEATGREVKTGASHGPALPDLQNLLPDANQIANYTQSYEYDAGGNLLEMRHVGAQLFTRTMRVALDSNRSLPADEVDVDFENGFDANGNLLQLVRGQDLSWDTRNQLRHITTVQRDDGPSDIETYIYDGGAQRCRKVSSAQTQNRTLINEVRYLPGLEIRSNADGEILHVVTVCDVRMLHWQAGKRRDIANDQLRYSLSDHLGSSTLELDYEGGLISQEGYYPFGGTAWWAARSAAEAKYKTVRYSGKELDASGLYYYGLRYYAPWLQRWINPDPSGAVDGLNVYCFVQNGAVSATDSNGGMKRNVTSPLVEPRPPPVIPRPTASLSEPGNWSLYKITNQPHPGAEQLRDIHQTLLDTSEAEDHPALIDYIERGHAEINDDLRLLHNDSEHQFSDSTKSLLESFENMRWMKAKSFLYRSIKVQPEGLRTLKEKGRRVADFGVQSATVTKRSAMEWGKTWAQDASSAPENVMLVFGMDVPKINLASGLFADHVAIFPGENLEVIEAMTTERNNKKTTYILLGKPADSELQRPVHSLFSGEVISTYSAVAKRLKPYSPRPPD